jgi:AAA family ATP:ADP antiporter
MLNPFEQIRPSERRQTYFAFLVLFGIMAGHALLETARDALFLASLPPARLAWVYLSIALVSLLVFALQGSDGRRQNPLSLCTWLLAAAGINVLFWILLQRPQAWALYALYTWSGVLATLLVVRFWNTVGDLFGTVGEAKRLYGPIVSGSVLGAIFGSSIARLMTGSLDPRHLLLAAAGIFVLTAIGPVLLLPQPESAAPGLPDAGRRRRLDLKRPLEAVWSRPFLRRLAAIVILSTVTLTLVDFLFKNAVAHNIAPAEYGSFFAGTYLLLNILSSVAQLLLVGRVMRTSRIHRVHSILPMLVLLGSWGLILGGGLVAAVLLKGFDGVLRHSLHRTATEVLYVPLTGDLRHRLRGFFDAIGQRGGQVVASLLILLAGVIGPTELVLAIAVVVLSILWLRATLTMESHYLGVFRAALRDVAITTRFDFPEMDLASLETLMAALNSNNDEEVQAALDVLAEQERAHLIPALILYHPSTTVVIRALEIFTTAGRQDFLGIMERLFEHPEPEVRAAALRSHAWVAAPRPELYERCFDDASPIVRATALIGLVSYYPPAQAAEAHRALDRLAATGTPEEKLALARAIRYSPGAGYERILMQLAESAHPAVQLAVARAMRELRNPRFIPKLLEMLPSRAVRAEVRATLVSIGSEALQQLDEVLGNRWYDPSIRVHVPRTIMHFPPEQAATILLHHYERETESSVRYRILRALGRLRFDNPDLELDESVLRNALDDALRNIFQLLDWKLNLAEGARRQPERATPVQGLIVSLLDHKVALAMERLFRLVGLLFPGEDVRTLYRGWRNPSRTTRDSSREILQHLLQPPLREPVQALVDDIDDAEKLARAGPFHAPVGVDYETLLENLLATGGVGMRCLVVYHVGETRMHSLRQTLEKLPSDLAGLVAKSVDRTLALLDADSEKVADGG